MRVLLLFLAPAVELVVEDIKYKHVARRVADGEGHLPSVTHD